MQIQRVLAHFERKSKNIGALKVFKMKPRSVDEVFTQKSYFDLGFLEVLDEPVSKIIGF